MSFLCCCVSKRGSHVNDDFTVDQLPKEGDEAVVVPCLWDSKKGKIQFVDKYPPQLLGICKPEDYGHAIATINKRIRSNRDVAFSKTFCLCGGCFSLFCSRTEMHEIRRYAGATFESVGLSLLYRTTKVPAVENAGEYRACGTPMHRAVWLEVRPNVFTQPAVPMGSVAAGKQPNPWDGIPRSKPKAHASAGAGSGDSSSSDDDNGAGGGGGDTGRGEQASLPGQLVDFDDDGGGDDKRRRKERKKKRKKHKKHKRRGGHSGAAKDGASETGDSESIPVEDGEGELLSRLRDESNKARAAAERDAESRATTASRASRADSDAGASEATDIESLDPEERRKRMMAAMGFSVEAQKAADDARREKEMGVAPEYTRAAPRKTQGPTAAELRARQEEADARRRERAEQLMMDKARKAEEAAMEAHHRQAELDRRTAQRMQLQANVEAQKASHEWEMKSAAQSRMRDAASNIMQRRAMAQAKAAEAKELKHAQSLLALNITPGQQVHPLYVGAGAPAAAVGAPPPPRAAEFDADGVPLPPGEMGPGGMMGPGGGMLPGGPGPGPGYGGGGGGMSRSYTHAGPMRAAARMALGGGRGPGPGAGPGPGGGPGASYYGGMHGMPAAAPGGARFDESFNRAPSPTLDSLTAVADRLSRLPGGPTGGAPPPPGYGGGGGGGGGGGYGGGYGGHPYR